MGVGVGGEGRGECFKPQSYSHFPKRSMIERRFSDQYKFELLNPFQNTCSNGYCFDYTYLYLKKISVNIWITFRLMCGLGGQLVNHRVDLKKIIGLFNYKLSFIKEKSNTFLLLFHMFSFFFRQNLFKGKYSQFWSEVIIPFSMFTMLQ